MQLDEKCRRAGGRGWFAARRRAGARDLDPIRQILKADEIVCAVPDARRRTRCDAASRARVSPSAPASMLQTHPRTTIYLDHESAALLARKPELEA